MELGLIGLGRMGGNMAGRLLRAGHRVVALDFNADAVRAMEAQGAVAAFTRDELVQPLAPPRTVWLMAPAGDATEETIEALVPLLQRGDVIIDGGNANYKDSMRRAASLKTRGFGFMDAGTSGGIWGGTEGYALMVGADEEDYKRFEPIFQALAPSPNQGVGR